MYITINKIIGKMTIDLSYSIHIFNPRKKITVIGILSDNIQYEMTEPFNLQLIAKQVLNKTYTSRELSALVEGKMTLSNLKMILE